MKRQPTDCETAEPLDAKLPEHIKVHVQEPSFHNYLYLTSSDAKEGHALDLHLFAARLDMWTC